jgi:RES domain-containing protein
MNITAWRTTRKKYIREAFSGEGAKQFGGRWNPAGYPAVYTAESLSLAILELMVHLDDDSDICSFAAIPVTFPRALVQVLPESQWPSDWFSLPIAEPSQQVGKKWLEEMSGVVLQVPSSVVPQECNYLINPLHPKFSRLEIGPPQTLHIDQRISNRLQ